MNIIQIFFLLFEYKEAIIEESFEVCSKYDLNIWLNSASGFWVGIR